MYTIQLNFIDDSSIFLEDIEDLDAFLNSIADNQIAYNKDKSWGFWFKGDQLRYMDIRKDTSCQKPNSDLENDLKH